VPRRRCRVEVPVRPDAVHLAVLTLRHGDVHDRMGGTAPPQITAAVWWLTSADGGATRSAAWARLAAVRVVARSMYTPLNTRTYRSDRRSRSVRPLAYASARVKGRSRASPPDGMARALIRTACQGSGRDHSARPQDHVLWTSRSGEARAHFSARDDLWADISDLDRQRSSRAEFSAAGARPATGQSVVRARGPGQKSWTGLTMSA
jgi:hypothetical protein